MDALTTPGRIKTVLLTLGILAFGTFLAGCEDDDGPFEEAGDSIEDAADELD